MATPVMNIDTAHADLIHDAQLDFYGRRLATCSSDKLIKVYDVSGDEHALSAELAVHDGPVWQVSWAHPQFGTLLASCGFDRRVVVQREVAPGQWTVIFVFEQHASSVNSVAWAPHQFGLRLACASSDGKISILSHNENDSWTVVTMEDCALGTNSVSWAPASSAPAGAKLLATAGCDGAVRVYRCTAAHDGSERWGLDAVLSGRHKEWVRDVAWCPSPIGDAGDASLLASCSDDGVVVLWRGTGAAAGAGAGAWTPEPLPQFAAPVWRVSWSTSGRLLAVSCGDNSITLWKESLAGAWVQVSSAPDPTLPLAVQGMGMGMQGQGMARAY